MDVRIQVGDYVRHFKRETLSEEAKEIPMYYSCNCYNGIYIIDIEYLIREEEYLFGKKKKKPTTCRSNLIQSIPTLITAENRK